MFWFVPSATCNNFWFYSTGEHVCPQRVLSWHHSLVYIVECISVLRLMFQGKNIWIKKNRTKYWDGKQKHYGLSRQMLVESSWWNQEWISWWNQGWIWTTMISWLDQVGLCWQQGPSEVVFCSWFFHCCPCFIPSLQISFILIITVGFMLFLVEITCNQDWSFPLQIIRILTSWKCLHEDRQKCLMQKPNHIKKTLYFILL